MDVYGNVITENNIDFLKLKKIIERPIIKPEYRISVLTPDERVDWVIPNEDILINGLSYSENYQNGQRRSLSLNLNNNDGKYTPKLNGIWINTKFKFDVGLWDNGQIIWFPKGVYILGNISLNNTVTDKTITYQLLDKFALFEGKSGTLETAYEVEVGSNIIDAIKGVQNFVLGNGYILDYANLYYDPSFFNRVTQSTIRVEEGNNLGQVIAELAIQLSAEYYYDNQGNLCLYPVNETVQDDVKPIIWTYKNKNRDLHNINLDYASEEVVNIVKVVGDNIDTGIYSYVAINNNIASPLCVAQIGKRMAPTYNEANVWSEDLAHDLAHYYLRKASFLAVNFNIPVSFNPILTVNNICEVENSDLNFKREKLLITSISFTSETGEMQLSCCNTTDLPFK